MIDINPPYQVGDIISVRTGRAALHEYGIVISTRSIESGTRYCTILWFDPTNRYRHPSDPIEEQYEYKEQDLYPNMFIFAR